MYRTSQRVTWVALLRSAIRLSSSAPPQPPLSCFRWCERTAVADPLSPAAAAAVEIPSATLRCRRRQMASDVRACSSTVFNRHIVRLAWRDAPEPGRVTSECGPRETRPCSLGGAAVVSGFYVIRSWRRHRVCCFHFAQSMFLFFCFCFGRPLSRYSLIQTVEGNCLWAIARLWCKELAKISLTRQHNLFRCVSEKGVERICLMFIDWRIAA